MNKKLFFSLCTLLGWGAMQAQVIQPDTLRPSVILTDEPHHTDNEAIKAIYEANGLHFQDPRAPRFLFLDRKGRVAMGIGGYFKGTLSADMGGIANSLDFVTADIPTPNRPDMRSQFQMDASTSRIFLKLVGKQTPVGDFTVYLESDFRGQSAGSYNMRLRQAYIQLGHIRAGKAWSTFFDPVAAPPTIDFEGPSGTVGVRNVMVQYSQKLDTHWSFAAAIENPAASYTTQAGKNEAINQRIPDIPAYLQYEWDDGQSHIRLSGLFRALSYRNLISNDNKYAIGWAGQLSGIIAITPQLTFYYQAAYGRGYANYLNDLGGDGYDLVAEGESGDMTAPYAFGFVGGLQYNINNRLFISTSSSQCRLYGEGNIPSTGYKYGQYMVVNAFYSLFNNCQLGVEYLYGNRHNNDHSIGKAHRINAMIQYNF
ncbi:MAG: porin [Bacteroides sp.]|nr:porin [Bacteroides sp.]